MTFAQAVGENGRAIGIEPDPHLLAAAQRRAKATGSTARFHSGDAYHVPFRANTFDAVLCERVFQHLTTPQRAATEIARVLKPGGRTVVVDADWGTAVVHPGKPSVIGEVINTLVNATTNPFSGRRISGQLSKAGLIVDEIGSHALVQERSVGAGALVSRISALAVMRGAITEAERRELLDDLAAGAATGDTHLSVTMFAVLAHSPA
jgi:ubiquinone/menaquinone biosynthesis C-methylase UbiE